MTGVALHAYGGDREEIAPLAARLRESLGIEVVAPDLPGHGSARATPLTLSACEAFLENVAGSEPGGFAFALGHSLGARLALSLDAAAYVLIAMPGEPVFDGGSREMVRVLRPSRVNEYRPFAGLVEALSTPLMPPERPTLLVVPEHELETGRLVAREWATRGIECLTVPKSDHRSVVRDPGAISAVCEWLRGQLQ